MKLTSFFFHIPSLIVLLALTGCSNKPSNIIIAPDVLATPPSYHTNKQAQLNVVDMRTASHIVQILKDGDAATLISSQERLEKTIKDELVEHWKKQGLSINPNAINTIKIEIDKAIISVEQSLMKYKAQTEIVLKVTINNGEQTLTSTFKNRGNSEGPLRADIAVLERDFNQRLAKVLLQILSNEKISAFLR